MVDREVPDATGDPQPCYRCASTVDVSYGPDPYAAEINDDDTDVWECADCRYESAMDI